MMLETLQIVRSTSVRSVRYGEEGAEGFEELDSVLFFHRVSEERSGIQVEKFRAKEFKQRRQGVGARELVDIQTGPVMRDYMNTLSAGIKQH